MMMGRHLLQSYKQKEKWVLSTPIINGTDGRKMSKSYGNYVALTDEPNEMYGKLMSVADEEIVPYFELLTDVADEEVATIKSELSNGTNPMTHKKRLAHTITTWLHSASDADAAQAHFEKTVQQKQVPDDVPEVRIEASPEQPLTAFALAKACLPEESNSQLRRLIEQSAMELLPSHHKPANADELIDASQLEVVRLGKRQYFKIIYV
jgi:tyrosyl-tRNA synthetase